MARIFLLIDGYNLLHAAGLGRRRFSRGGLELARTKLLQKLAAGQQQLAPVTMCNMPLIRIQRLLP